MFTLRTLGEGKWPLLGFGLLTIITLLLNRGQCWCWFFTALAALLFLFVVAFFRDPERAIPADPSVIVSPADGKVVEVRTVNEPQFMKGDCQMVAIFLSVFNVHVQRAPVAGQIKWVQYQPGQFLDARNPNAGARNEARCTGIETPDGFRCMVRQVAGLIARRIVGWNGEGATVAKGEQIGMIRFGSRVELYLPPTAEVTVQVGQHIAGGKDVIARKR